MKRANLSFSIALVLLLTSCFNNTQQDETVILSEPTAFFFTGEFTEYAGRPVLMDCISGEVLTISNKGKFHKLEQEFKKLDPAATEAINCSVIGTLIKKNTEDEGPDKQLLISEIIQFEQGAIHTPSLPITDRTYICYLPDEEHAEKMILLSFNKDHTFQSTAYQIEPLKILNEYNGDWFCLSKDSLYIYTCGNNSYKGHMNFDKSILTFFNHDGDMIFKKKE